MRPRIIFMVLRPAEYHKLKEAEKAGIRVPYKWEENLLHPTMLVQAMAIALTHPGVARLLVFDNGRIVHKNQ